MKTLAALAGLLVFSVSLAGAEEIPPLPEKIKTLAGQKTTLIEMTCVPEKPPFPFPVIKTFWGGNGAVPYIATFLAEITENGECTVKDTNEKGLLDMKWSEDGAIKGWVNIPLIKKIIRDIRKKEREENNKKMFF